MTILLSKAWLTTLEHTLAQLHAQATPEHLVEATATLATLTSQFDALPAPEKAALLPHLAQLQARLALVSASLRAEQTNLKTQLTAQRTLSNALGAYKVPGAIK
jgi:hypothetical protein